MRVFKYRECVTIIPFLAAGVILLRLVGVAVGIIVCRAVQIS